MPFRSLACRGIAIIAAAVTVGQAAAQAGPVAKLAGKWVMDSTNGADDHGLPKSETLVFSPQPAGFRITATEDDGQGPSTSAFDCTPSGASTPLGQTDVMLCTIHVAGDSILYALDDLRNGQTVSTERGRLVPLSGRMLRDEYEATTGSHKPTRHRHVYERQ